MADVPAQFYSAINVIIEGIDKNFAGVVTIVNDLEFAEEDIQGTELMKYAVRRKAEHLKGGIAYYVTMGTCHMVVGEIPEKGWKKLYGLNEVN